ncbi:MAG: hypothetical protein U9R07_07590 [Pseudomonadota bacterium]|nr:hypothetical protein [Pseudomonadota bacterium]
MTQLAQAIDRLDTLAERYRRPISFFSALIFVLSCATWAGFIRWPNFELLSERQAVMISTGWNALWWGFLNPRIMRRRAERAAAAEASTPA